jgi:cytochrome oxidase assembly protein ShyY1
MVTPVAPPKRLLRDWPALSVGLDGALAKHYAYAAQWFALAVLIVILYVWFQLITPRRRVRTIPNP